jgi:hypothetical protein
MLVRWQKEWEFRHHLVFRIKHRYAISFYIIIIPTYEGTFKLPMKAFMDNDHIDLESLEPCTFSSCITNLVACFT